VKNVDTHLFDRFRIVLVRPKDSKNLGATARAMTNMCLSHLVLVAPRCEIDDDAYAVAVGCRAVLESARVVDTIPDAVRGCGLTVGMTRRGGRHRPVSRRIRSSAVRWAGLAAENEIALLFGPEESGLSGDELTHCRELVRIPTGDAFPSINLAQSVMIVAYEVFMAVTGGPTPPIPGRLASAEEREALLDSMFEALKQLEYFGGREPKYAMQYFRKTFDRAGLSPDDVRLWRGVFERVLRRVD